MRICWLAFALLLCGGQSLATTPIDRAFERLYNFDFGGAHKILDGYIGAQPSDPLSYAVRGSALLFEELDRLQILESEFFADDKRIIDKKKLRPDPMIRDRFFQSVNEAQNRAKSVLSTAPTDANALFTMCLSSGLVADYTALVEKRQWSSFSHIKQSHEYAIKLIKTHPDFSDAYLTTGVTEYLVGSLPFFLRWFVRLDQIDGSKVTAAHNLERVAKSGRYLKAFSKILLSVVYLRDKKIPQTLVLLKELHRDYPENPLIRKELTKVAAQLSASPN